MCTKQAKHGGPSTVPKNYTQDRPNSVVPTFIFACNTGMHSQNSTIFGTYKLKKVTSGAMPKVS